MLTLERMTALLKRAGICLTCGSRNTYHGQCLDCIIAEDKRVNWPRTAATEGSRS